MQPHHNVGTDVPDGPKKAIFQPASHRRECIYAFRKTNPTHIIRKKNIGKLNNQCFFIKNLKKFLKMEQKSGTHRLNRHKARNLILQLFAIT